MRLGSTRPSPRRALAHRVPPISVHFALGVAAAFLVARRLPRREDRGPVALGLVAGAVMPDADLLVSSVASLFASGTDVGKLIHRTLTHSIPFAVAIAGAGAWMTRSREKRAWGVGLVAFAAAALALHAVPDLFYLVGVKLLFPFSLAEFEVGPFRLERFTDAQNNALNGFDFLSESFTWLALWFLAREYGLATRFTRWLPALAAVNFLLYAWETIFIAPTVDYDAFLYWSYYPGVLNIVVSTLLVPILGRRAWMAFGEGPPPKRVIVGRPAAA